MPRNQDRDQKQKLWSLQEGKLGVLRAAADESARHVRGLYFKFLLFAFYVAVIVFSTDDEQLLKGTGAELPLLGVELPLVGFYVVVPWLILIFHAHLLSQFYLLSRKLFDLDQVLRALPSESARIQRGLIFPLIFSHRIVGTQHPRLIRRVFGAAMVVTILMTPILLLGAVQYKFLPYHGAWITFNHQLVFTFDLLLLWIFWPRLFSRSGRWRDCWSRSRPRWGIWISTLLGALVSAILIFGAWILVVPHVGDIEEWLVENWLVRDKQEGSAGNQQGLPWIHRNLVLHEQTLMRKNPPVELLSAAREKQDQDGKKQDQDPKAEAEVWLKDGEALELRGRDLRYADFYKSRLWDADLREARLEGADLSEAQLQGADLEEAQLQGAVLSSAQLQGANLSDAQLQDANLYRAQLEGARLSKAQLQGADLEGEQLQGAVLREAQLQGAVLRRAVVYGTRFRDAELLLADLRGLRLPRDEWEGGSG